MKNVTWDENRRSTADDSTAGGRQATNGIDACKTQLHDVLRIAALDPEFGERLRLMTNVLRER